MTDHHSGVGFGLGWLVTWKVLIRLGDVIIVEHDHVGSGPHYNIYCECIVRVLDNKLAVIELCSFCQAPD